MSGRDVFREALASEEAGADAALHQERRHRHEGREPLSAGQILKHLRSTQTNLVLLST